jgi:hypothetical protein
MSRDQAILGNDVLSHNVVDISRRVLFQSCDTNQANQVVVPSEAGARYHRDLVMAKRSMLELRCLEFFLPPLLALEYVVSILMAPHNTHALITYIKKENLLQKTKALKLLCHTGS